MQFQNQITLYFNNTNVLLIDNFIWGHGRSSFEGERKVNIALFNPMKRHEDENYEINKDKKDIIDEIKKISKNSKYIFLASDNDREGESIS
jgi:DNA topoisomerase IA